MHRRSFIKTFWNGLALLFLPSVAPAQFATFFDPPYLAGPLSAAAGGNAYDDLESYPDLSDLNGLNGGSVWPSAYISRSGDVAIRAADDLETYTDSATLNGLNAGSGWNGAFVDR